MNAYETQEARAQRFAVFGAGLRRDYPTIPAATVERTFEIKDTTYLAIANLWNKVVHGVMPQAEAVTRTRDLCLEMYKRAEEAGLGKWTADQKVAMAESKTQTMVELHAKGQAMQINLAMFNDVMHPAAQLSAEGKALLEAKAMIQFLNLKIQSRDAEIQQLKHENQGLTTQVDRLKDVIQGHENVGSSMLANFQHAMGGTDLI